MDARLELGVGFEVRVAFKARVELARVGLVAAARDAALVVEQREHAVGLVLDQREDARVVREGDEVPRDLLARVPTHHETELQWQLRRLLELLREPIRICRIISE